MKKGPAKVGGVSDNGAAGVNVSGEEGAPKPDEGFFCLFFFLTCSVQQLSRAVSQWWRGRRRSTADGGAGPEGEVCYKIKI